MVGSLKAIGFYLRRSHTSYVLPHRYISLVPKIDCGRRCESANEPRLQTLSRRDRAINADYCRKRGNKRCAKVCPRNPQFRVAEETEKHSICAGTISVKYIFSERPMWRTRESLSYSETQSDYFSFRKLCNCDDKTIVTRIVFANQNIIDNSFRVCRIITLDAGILTYNKL